MRTRSTYSRSFDKRPGAGKIGIVWPLAVIVGTSTSMMYPVAGFSKNPSFQGSEASASAERYADGKRKWNAETSINMRYFNSLLDLDNTTQAEIRAGMPDPVYFSHDRKRFAVQSWRGDLGSDEIVVALEFYDVVSVRRWLAGPTTQVRPRPIAVLERRSSSHTRKTVLNQIKWSRDGDTVTFVGLDKSDTSQIFSFSIDTNSIKQLTDETNPSLQIDDYEVEAGSIFLIGGELSDPALRPAEYPLLWLPRKPNGDINLQMHDVKFVLRARTGSANGWTLPFWSSLLKVWISPDGRAAILLAKPDGGAAQLFSVDLLGKRLEALKGVTTPARSENGALPQILWSQDSKLVIFAGVEFEGPAPQMATSHDSSTHILSYELDSGRARAVADAGVSVDKIALNWSPDGNLIVLGDGGSASYSLRDGDWFQTGSLAARALPSENHNMDDFHVIVRDGLNEPPVLVAIEGKKEKVMSPPDPVLAGVWIAPVTQIEFDENDGSAFKGLLSVPRFINGPVPVVVQLEDSALSNGFAPDGSITMAFARQALNARGFAVLSLDGWSDFGRKLMTPEEGPLMVDRIDEAISVLAKQKLIDPNRVGLVGFSHSGWLTSYAVTHQKKTKFAAAQVFDSVTFSFLEYTAYAGMHPGAEQSAAAINGGSFWSNKTEWLRRDIVFNFDSMQTPTLFAATSTSGGAGKSFGSSSSEYAENLTSRNWFLNIFGALATSKRPFDFMLFPEAIHSAVQPRQRKASIDATVDWFSYWLKDERDPDPAKLALYERWDSIRAAWQNQLAWEAKGNAIASKPSAETSSLSQAIADDIGRQRVREEMKQLGVDDPGLDPFILNQVGYEALYGENNPQKALRYMRWNNVLFPNNPDLLDSLAEASIQAGDREGAIEYWEQALALVKVIRTDPDAASRLKRLRENPASLKDIQREMRSAATK